MHSRAKCLCALATLVSLAVALILPSPAAYAAGPALKYVVLVDDGRKAGHLDVVRGDDGIVRVDYLFKDNGRGPELKEEFVLGADGAFATYSVQGKSTFGAPVEERFRVEAGEAVWSSTSEEGRQPLEAGAFYAPLGGTPYATSLAVAALAKRGGERLPLIPAGGLSLEQVDEVELGGAGAPVLRARLVKVTGIDLVPTFLWLTGDDEPRLFAFIMPGWMQLIQDGWQSSAPTLEDRQRQAQRSVLMGMNKRLGKPLGGTTLIRNARVFDSRAAVLGEPSDVLLRDGRIVAVLAMGEGGSADRVIDAGGRVLTPGLFDMHGHIDEWQGGLHLAAGVTTVRDMGNDNATLQRLMSAERSGKLLSPSVVAAGFIEGESPMSARNGFVVSNLAAAKKAVDWYADRKYVGVKIYNSFPKDILRETVAYAHSRDLRVSGHVPVYLRAQDVVDAGFDEIQHINQVLLNFLVDETTDTRTLERFYLPARGVADLDFDSAPVQDFIAALAGGQIAVDPTVATFDFIRHRAGQTAPAFVAVADHLPSNLQRSLKVASFDIPDDEAAARYERSYQKMVEFVGRMYRAGVPILAGTDGMPGFTLQRELELYVQAGMTPAQALQTATWTAARHSRTMDDRGAIEAGKRADLVLFDGDPTRDIGDLRRAVLVIKNGVAYAPSELYTAFGIKPFAEAVPLE